MTLIKAHHVQFPVLPFVAIVFELYEMIPGLCVAHCDTGLDPTNA